MGRREGKTFEAAIPGMTPARFDILHAIHSLHRHVKHRLYGYRMGMADIRQRLGLSRQTIWVAVQRLVELGFVTKEHDDFRPHLKVVRLTAVGLRTIRAAYHRVWTDRRLPRHYRAYFARWVPKGARGLAARVEPHLKAFWLGLVGIARHLGNRADPYYALPHKEPHVCCYLPARRRARLERRPPALVSQAEPSRGIVSRSRRRARLRLRASASRCGRPGS